MGKIKPKCHFGLQKVRVHDLVRGESQEQEEEKEEEIKVWNPYFWVLI